MKTYQVVWGMSELENGKKQLEGVLVEADGYEFDNYGNLVFYVKTDDKETVAAFIRNGWYFFKVKED